MFDASLEFNRLPNVTFVPLYSSGVKRFLLYCGSEHAVVALGMDVLDLIYSNGILYPNTRSSDPSLCL